MFGFGQALFSRKRTGELGGGGVRAGGADREGVVKMSGKMVQLFIM